MCSFLSAIVKKDGEILWDAYTDSHEDLVATYGLDDSKFREGFVRIEFNPEDYKDYDKPDKYILRVDEKLKPDWFVAVEKTVADQLKGIIERMILRDVKKKCLLSGCYILTGKTNIDYIKNTRVFFMCGTSEVGEMWGTSKVGEMWGTSKVGEMRETSKVGEMRGTSKVGEMRGTSKVGEMCETSKVGEMWETSKVGEMWETSKVGEMRETSEIVKDNRNK